MKTSCVAEVTFDCRKRGMLVTPEETTFLTLENVIREKKVEGLQHNGSIASIHKAGMQHTILSYNQHYGHTWGGWYNWWDCDFFVRNHGITMG